MGWMIYKVNILSPAFPHLLSPSPTPSNIPFPFPLLLPFPIPFPSLLTHHPKQQNKNPPEKANKLTSTSSPPPAAGTKSPPPNPSKTKDPTPFTNLVLLIRYLDLGSSLSLVLILCFWGGGFFLRWMDGWIDE